MQLHLTLAGSWRRPPRARRLAHLVVDGRAELELTWSPLQLLPDDDRYDTWVRAVLGAGLRRDQVLALEPGRDGATACGWPMRQVAAAVTGGGELVEVRSAACFAFLEHAASALVRARDHLSLARHRAAIDSAFATARPDWRDGPACVAELFRT